METIDDETTAAAIDFIEQPGARPSKPFFTWMNFTRMHVFTHVRARVSRARAACAGNEYADGMWEMDQNVGKLLKARRRPGSPTTRSSSSRPTTARTLHLARCGHHAVPLREGHELGGRLPRAGDGPLAGQDQARSISNGIFSGLDWFPTLLAAAGDTTVKDRLLKGWPPSAARPSKCISMATTSCRTCSGPDDQECAAPTSPTSTTMATWSRCVRSIAPGATTPMAGRSSSASRTCPGRFTVW